jgi:hypothetical protein
VWHTESNFLVLVAVEDEPALLALAAEAHRRSIQFCLIEEPDWPGKPATALVLQPGPDASKLCANLPLALKGPAMAS